MSIANIKHKFYRPVFIGALLGSVCLAPITSALADTTFPEEFRGNVTVNGAPAPVGARIIAKINGVERGSFTITEAGKYGATGTFSDRLVVSGDEADVDHTITFWINGSQASQTPVYEPGESKELDLSVTHTYTHPLTTGNAWVTSSLDYLRSRQNADGDIGGLGISAWVVMAISAAGEDPNNWKVGVNSIVDYLRDNASSLGDIATDWARSILAIAAAGENPWDFGGVDYVAKLKTYHDGSQIGSASLLNDDFWSVLALISVSESQSSEIITDSVAFIKDNQNDDGGWSHIVDGASDVDNTAAAIMALIAAGESANSTAIVNALSYLESNQQTDGGFLSEGSTNAAADSWAINAIVAAGQNPTSNDWTNNGNNPVGHLLSLQIADGSFNWTASLNSNPEWMTAYAIPALLGKPYPIAIVTPPSDGGNGGSGGGSSGGGGGLPGVTYVIDSVTQSGKFTEDVTAKSDDGKVKLNISEGTTGKKKGGQSLRTITMTKMEEPPDPPTDSDVIGLVYDCSPDGATFDPPISMTFKYDLSLLPADAREENLMVAFWDEVADEWVELESTVGPDSNTITAEVSHFTGFTILIPTRPAAFTIADLVITPDEVEIGETVTISASVTNTGDLTGTYEVTLKIDDTAVKTKEVEVAGGDSEKVSFRITRDTVRTYTVDVNGLSGSFVVKEQAPSLTSPPTPPQPSPEPTLPPAPPLPPQPSAKPINWPLIGAVIAGVIVFSLLIFFLVKRLTY